MPAGLELNCRPIGCEQCWQNDFCEVDSDCPANHSCHPRFDGNGNEVNPFPILTPVCALRQLASPSFVEYLVDEGFVSPEAAAELEETIAKVRTKVQDIFSSIRLPDTFSSEGSAASIVDFAAKLSDIYVSMEEPAGPAHQGVIVLHMEFIDSSAQAMVSGIPIFVSFSDPWTVDINFVPAVIDRSTSEPDEVHEGPAYRGITFSLHSVELGGSISVLGWDVSLDSLLHASIKNQLADFGDKSVSGLLDIFGTYVGDDPALQRCIFVDHTRFDKLPQKCGDGEFEAPYMVRVQDDLLDITSERCQ